MAIISFINLCCNFNLDFLSLVGVGSLTCFGVGSVATSGSVFGSVGSRVGILSKFVIGNNLLLKLITTFSLALNNNSKLFIS